jgi:hypothetical protein
MNRPGIFLISGMLALASTAAGAQTPMPIRGSVTGLEGNVLSVKSHEGKDFKVILADNLAVNATRAITPADIKPGDYVGSGSMKRPDGTLVALEVQLLPAALRGVVREGHRPWDAGPDSTMTNATLSAMVQTAGGRELTLDYKGGSQKIFVPEGVPMFTTVPSDRSQLVPGAEVFVSAQLSADGKIFASRVRLNKGGTRPLK